MTDTNDKEPTLGETLGAMVGKILGELEQLGVRNDGARVGTLRNELSDVLEAEGAPANVRAAALAAELVRELDAEPMLLRMVEERLQLELEMRLDSEAPTARLDEGGSL